MDRGFRRQDNIRWLRSNKMKHVPPLGSFHKTARSSTDKVRNDIDKQRNRIEYGIYAMSTSSSACGVRSDVHVCFSPALREEELKMKEDILKIYRADLGETKKIAAEEYKKYSCCFDAAASSGNAFKFYDNIYKIEEMTKCCGYCCLLSNLELNSREIRKYTSKKYKIEKCFDDSKNSIDQKRMRTHENEKSAGKMFCAFASLIAASRTAETLQAMNAASGKKRLSETDLYDELDAIQTEAAPGGFSLANPLSKEQKDILFQLGLNESI